MEPAGTFSSEPPQFQQQPPRRSSRISLDARWLVVILLLVIIGMLAVWRPWSATPSRGSDARTIKVTGEATVKAEPDQYVFSPTYQFQNADRAAALDALAKKSNEITDGLKKAGVKDSQIKSNADDYRSGNGGIAVAPIAPGEPNGRPTPIPAYDLRLTITVQDKALAQKVQGYLTSTAPSGSVTPSNTFSTSKRKELESKARDEATKDARGKAEQSAKNLGFKVGDVKSVSDGSGFGVFPVYENKTMAMDASGSTASSIAVQPGENELSYSVSVEYFVK